MFCDGFNQTNFKECDEDAWLTSNFRTSKGPILKLWKQTSTKLQVNVAYGNLIWDYP